jgi:4'-phosphopantetheinyl transferase
VTSNGAAGLEVGEVVVWHASLDATTPAPRLIAADESARAARMPPVRRRRFIAARAILRRVLGRHLDRDPAALVFEYGAAGKPRLSGGDIDFNMAHSGDTALIAVSRAGAVGVDVERVRPIRKLERVAAAWLSAGELELWRRLSPELRLDGLYRFWTRKEAYIKALGAGLPPSPRRVPAAPDGWQTVELDAGEGFRAALALATEGRLVCGAVACLELGFGHAHPLGGDLELIAQSGGRNGSGVGADGAADATADQTRQGMALQTRHRLALPVGGRTEVENQTL